MTAHRSFFHVAILVDDLEKAIERFANVLEVDFLSPTLVHVDSLEEPDHTESCNLRLTFSRQGPPYYELLEAQGDGIFGLRQGLGVHHIGVWEPDAEFRVEQLVHAHGMRKEGVMFTPEKRISVAYMDRRDLYGTRIELVAEGRRPQLESWLAGGPWLE